MYLIAIASDKALTLHKF